MAFYENLPVFKASYDLLLELTHLRQHMKRDIRYSLGDELNGKLMEMMLSIYKANLVYEKAPFLSDARQKMVEIKLYIRLLHDLKQISIKKYAVISVSVESISKQLSAWHKSVSRVSEK